MGPDEAARTPPSNEDGAPDPDPSTATDPTLQRRMFLRRMAADAIVAGGRLAGTAQIIQRSAAAAGETLRGELGARQAAAAGAPVEDRAIPAKPTAPNAPTDSEAVRELEPSQPWKAWSQTLTTDQETLLESA